MSNLSSDENHSSFVITRSVLSQVIVLLALLVLVFQLDYQWTRMIHIVAGFVWYSMLVFLVIIFLPALKNFSDSAIYEMIGQIVPRIFHTVTVAGFLAVGVGWYNAFFLSNGKLTYFYRDPIDIVFTITITLVTLMYFFHLFLESSEINISSKVALGEIDMESDEYQALIRGIQLTPRVGFVIISVAIVVMFIH